MIQRTLQDFRQIPGPIRAACFSTIDNLRDMMKLKMTIPINYQTKIYNNIRNAFCY